MRKDVDDVRWLIFAWIISAIVFVMIVLLWHLLMGQSFAIAATDLATP